MTLGSLKQSRLKRQINKNVNSTNAISNDSAKEVQSVLIIVDMNSPEDLPKEISMLMGLEVNNMVAIKFMEDVAFKNLNEKEFSQKSFNWKGKIKSNYINEIVSKEYDLLINYTSNNLYSEYLSSIARALFKIGFANEISNLYDLSISLDNNEYRLFNEELIKYLKILKKI